MSTSKNERVPGSWDQTTEAVGRGAEPDAVAENGVPTNAVHMAAMSAADASESRGRGLTRRGLLGAIASGAAALAAPNLQGCPGKPRPPRSTHFESGPRQEEIERVRGGLERYTELVKEGRGDPHVYSYIMGLVRMNTGQYADKRIDLGGASDIYIIEQTLRFAFQLIALRELNNRITGEYDSYGTNPGWLAQSPYQRWETLTRDLEPRGEGGLKQQAIDQAPALAPEFFQVQSLEAGQATEGTQDDGGNE